MKRPFAFIGFSCAAALIILNIIEYKYCAGVFAASAAIFTVSLLIKRTRRAKVLPTVFGSIAFACAVFIIVNAGAVLPADGLDGKNARAQFKIVDIPGRSSDGSKYVYTVKTDKIMLDGAPQQIKLKLYSSQRLDCDYYESVSGSLRFFKNAESAFDSYGEYGRGIYLSASLFSFETEEQEATKPPNY